ncbi:unnamed protein product [Amoebophrya sp. A25]|nr:unnamed protein product [Amoebophrya sp. A25]|eukprot:GSA25T00004624001.1
MACCAGNSRASKRASNGAENADAGTASGAGTSKKDPLAMYTVSILASPLADEPEGSYTVMTAEEKAALQQLPGEKQMPQGEGEAAPEGEAVHPIEEGEALTDRGLYRDAPSPNTMFGGVVPVGGGSGGRNFTIPKKAGSGEPTSGEPKSADGAPKSGGGKVWVEHSGFGNRTYVGKAGSKDAPASRGSAAENIANQTSAVEPISAGGQGDVEPVKTSDVVLTTPEAAQTATEAAAPQAPVSPAEKGEKEEEQHLEVNSLNPQVSEGAPVVAMQEVAGEANAAIRKSIAAEGVAGVKEQALAGMRKSSMYCVAVVEEDKASVPTSVNLQEVAQKRKSRVEAVAALDMKMAEKRTQAVKSKVNQTKLDADALEQQRIEEPITALDSPRMVAKKKAHRVPHPHHDRPQYKNLSYTPNARK